MEHRAVIADGRLRNLQLQPATSFAALSGGARKLTSAADPYMYSRDIEIRSQTVAIFDAESLRLSGPVGPGLRTELLLLLRLVVLLQ